MCPVPLKSDMSQAFELGKNLFAFQHLSLLVSTFNR